MKKYIKVNVNGEICDVFFKYQKDKFDGTEILISDTDKKHKLADYRTPDELKSISDEMGNYIFWYSNSNIIEVSTETLFVNKYKKQRYRDLKALIKDNLVFSDKSIDQIKNQIANLKSQHESWQTRSEVDTAFDTFIDWLNIDDIL